MPVYNAFYLKLMKIFGAYWSYLYILIISTMYFSHIILLRGKPEGGGEHNASTTVRNGKFILVNKNIDLV